MNEINAVKEIAGILKKSKFTTVFTGAGISVESGIPPFRGENGIWTKYDPHVLDIGYFMENPALSWQTISEIFYRYFGKAKPNEAHKVIAQMEKLGMPLRVITQNIDNLHQEAGNQTVYEFHGNAKKLICLSCPRDYMIQEVSLDHLPPTCKECGGLLKPDFVFFGEPIPQIAFMAAHEAAAISEVFLIIGTTGEVMPANQFPFTAKRFGAKIIEINPNPSQFTSRITDHFLQGKAGEIMGLIGRELFSTAL